MTRRSLAVLLLALPLNACAEAPPAATPLAATPPAAEPAIREALAKQADAWNRHDAHAWVAAFSEDAEFINILGMKFVGRSEIERRHAEIFGSIFSQSQVVVTTRKVRALGPSAALVETDYALTGYARLPPGISATDADGTLRTRLKYVWSFDGSAWRIVAGQNTAIFPPPGAAAHP